MNYFCPRMAHGTEVLTHGMSFLQVQEAINLRLAILAMISPRYLQSRQYTPRNTRWISEVLPSLGDPSFRHFLRMDRRDFGVLLHRMENGPGLKLFQNKSFNSQAPVSLQFATTLMRLGLSGNGASVESISVLTRVSKGAIINSYRRVTRALVLMAEQEIKWPSSSERQDLRRKGEERGLPNAFFAVDGTTIPLYEKPCVDHEAFFDRKSNYSLHALISCNWNRVIINAVVGFPGSVHDNRVIRSCRFLQEEHENEFFSGCEHGIGDSAFVAFRRVVPPYKMPAAAMPDNAFFNSILASLRIISEHAIGLLKGRFQSLKELRVRVETKADPAKCCEHIIACIVLHNMLLRNGGGREEHFMTEGEGSDEDDVSSSLGAESIPSAIRASGEQFRTRVKEECLLYHGYEE